MMNAAFLILTSSEDEVDHEVTVQRRVLRQRVNIFTLPDSMFMNYFRLNKDAFTYVLQQIRPKLKVGRRSMALSPEIKLATALRFLVQGSYQTSVGNDFNLAVAQPTVSVVLSEILNAIETTLCQNWIKADMTVEEKAEAKEYFFNKTGFPGVIGCVDGTHIKIISPEKDEANLYYNRKGFYSLNAMVVCDNKMRIKFFDARHAGSAHDSLVWNVSHMKRILQERFDNGERSSWLLGDAGYPLHPFLMTPYWSAEPGSRESNYNSTHARARNIVERTIGLLKSRFRCLLGARELHYKPAKATKIANLCAALHNICIYYNAQHNENYDDIIEQERVLPELQEIREEGNAEGIEIRNTIRDNLM